MKKLLVLMLMSCMIQAMDIRQVVREDREREKRRHHRRSRSSSPTPRELQAMQARIDALEASGDEAEEDIDKISRLTQANNERLQRLEQQMQLLVAAYQAREQAERANGGDPVLLKVREVKSAVDAISDRQIENSRYSFLGAFAGVGIIAAHLGMKYLAPEWVWSYLPGAS